MKEASPNTFPGTSQPSPAKDVIVIDHWTEDKRYTLVQGADENSLKIRHLFGNILFNSQPPAGEVFVFDDTIPPDVVYKLAATPLSRLLCVYHSLAGAETGPAFVLSIGYRNAVAGVVDSHRVLRQKELPDLSLTSLWKGYRDTNGLLDEYLNRFPGEESVLFKGFTAALRGEFLTNLPIPFVMPELGFLADRVAAVLQELDPDHICSVLMLTDWAGTEGFRRVVKRAKEIIRVTVTIVWSDNSFRDAYRGVFRLRGIVAPVKKALTELVTAVRKDKNVGVGIASQVERLARNVAVRFNDPVAYIELFSVIDRPDHPAPPGMDELLRLAELVRVQYEKNAELTAADLDNVELRGTELPDNIPNLLSQGGKLVVVKTIEPGYRSKNTNLLKRPVVEVRFIEPPHWRLVGDTKKKLGDTVRFYNTLLDSCLEHRETPQDFFDLLDTLRKIGEQKLLNMWLEFLGITEVVPVGRVNPAQIAQQELELENPKIVGESGLYISEVVRVGYRAVKDGRILRAPRVKVISDLDRLILETRAANLRKESIEKVLDMMAQRQFDFANPDGATKLAIMDLLDMLPGFGRPDLKTRWLNFWGLEEYWSADDPSHAWAQGYRRGQDVWRKPAGRMSYIKEHKYPWLPLLITIGLSGLFFPYFWFTSQQERSLSTLVTMAVAVIMLVPPALLNKVSKIWFALLFLSAAIMFIANRQVMLCLLPLYIIVALCGIVPGIFNVRVLRVAVPLLLCSAVFGPFVIKTAPLSTTGQPRGRRATIVRNQVNFRRGANRDSVVVERLSRNTLVFITDSVTTESGVWYKVYTASTRRSGWLHADAFVPYRRFMRVVQPGAAVDSETGTPVEWLFRGDSVEVVDRLDSVYLINLGEGLYGLVDDRILGER